jgi:hypothetical protein
MDSQTQDAPIFKQNRGQIAVTSNELIIEGQKWNLTSIVSIEIMTKLLRPGEGQSAFHVYNPVIQRKMWPSMTLGIIAMVLFVLLHESLLVILAFLPLLMGVLYQTYLLNKYPQEVYGLRLKLKRGENLYSEYEPAYRWKDRPSAQRVLAAVERARPRINIS